MAEQVNLLAVPIADAVPPGAPLAELPAGNDPVLPQPKYRTVDRNQKTMAVIDVEELISQNHKARAMWELMGKMDLSKFGEQVKSKE